MVRSSLIIAERTTVEQARDAAIKDRDAANASLECLRGQFEQQGTDLEAATDERNAASTDASRATGALQATTRTAEELSKERDQANMDIDNLKVINGEQVAEIESYKRQLASHDDAESSLEQLTRSERNTQNNFDGAATMYSNEITSHGQTQKALAAAQKELTALRNNLIQEK